MFGKKLVYVDAGEIEGMNYAVGGLLMKKTDDAYFLEKVPFSCFDNVREDIYRIITELEGRKTGFIPLEEISSFRAEYGENDSGIHIIELPREIYGHIKKCIAARKRKSDTK